MLLFTFKPTNKVLRVTRVDRDQFHLGLARVRPKLMLKCDKYLSAVVEAFDKNAFFFPFKIK
jgi:hypothetical protein